MGLKKEKRIGSGMQPTQIVACWFLGMILVGTLLLKLPAAAQSGHSVPLLTALFTATSASCVTGLSLVNTADCWTPFGQAVILCMIQIGGLGFMTMATFFSLLFHRTITLRERMLMSTALSLSAPSGVVRLTRKILLGTFCLEGAGAAILTIRFLFRHYTLGESLWRGVFLAVSAFCNAGFDLTPSASGFSSMMPYQNDWIICGTLMVLIIVGGLGFFVWSDLWTGKEHRLSMHTKMVLATTVFLTVMGTLLIGLFEGHNPATLGGMSGSHKLLAALFQSVTCRTAGFAGIDQGSLTGAGQGISIFLMIIGGSPGSTAGGLKTVTAIVLLMTAVSVCRGSDAVTLGKRTISQRSVMNAMTMCMLFMVMIFVGTFCIAGLEGSRFAFGDLLYETISAVATVGLSTGITGALSVASQIVLVVLMYLGRVGILTFGLALMRGERKNHLLQYAEEDVLIG
jgi:trk system potassium uptake protein TrkH